MGETSTTRFWSVLANRLRSGVPAQQMAAPIEWQTIPIYVVLIAQISAIIVGFQITDFSLDHQARIGPAACLLIFLGSGMLLRRIGHRRIGGWFEAVGIFIICGLIGLFSSVMLAATNLPLTDALLITGDALIGFDWREVFMEANRHQWFVDLSRQVYLSLNWQPFLLITVLFILDIESRCWKFLLAWVISLTITLIVFPFFPALSPPDYYNIRSPLAVPVETAKSWIEILQASRDGSLRIIGANNFVGLITFPSFHACAAALLGWGFAGVRWLRVPFVSLNIAMALSAIIIGGHYLVDVLAGVFIAALAVMAAGGVIEAMYRNDVTAYRRFRGIAARRELGSDR
jgi:membrane-associated phospholipid phosphatase